MVRTLPPRSEPRTDTVSVTAFRYLPPLIETEPVTLTVSVVDLKYRPPVIATGCTVIPEDHAPPTITGCATLTVPVIPTGTPDVTP